MTAKSHKLGPGSLKFGDVGDQVEFATRLRECTVKNDTQEGDVLPVLSGDEIEEGDEDSYTLEGKVLQDYDTDSLIAWAYKNAGTVVSWRFQPDNDKALAAKGRVKVRRLDIGGTVKARNESAFVFPGREGMYELVNADLADAPITTYSPVAPTEPPAVDPVEWD